MYCKLIFNYKIYKLQLQLQITKLKFTNYNYDYKLQISITITKLQLTNYKFQLQLTIYNFQNKKFNSVHYLFDI